MRGNIGGTFMKAKFFVNPSSGRQNYIKVIEEIRKSLKEQRIVEDIEVYFTKGTTQDRLEIESLKENEYNFVVAVGGDGTINEVINGIIKSQCNIPLAIISAGTTNDFASYMKLPKTAKEFCKMIEGFKTVYVDAGRINQRYFINVASGGLLTDVGSKVPKNKKALFGKLAYIAEGVKDFTLHAFKTFPVHIESEELTGDMDITLFLIANSQSVGGFKKIAPKAEVTDGYLDVVIIKKIEPGQLFNLFGKLMQGEHFNHSTVEYIQTKKIAISSSKDIEIDYDGECFGKLPIEVEVVSKAINIIVPE